MLFLVPVRIFNPLILYLVVVLLLRQLLPLSVIVILLPGRLFLPWRVTPLVHLVIDLINYIRNCCHQYGACNYNAGRQQSGKHVPHLFIILTFLLSYLQC